MNNRKIHVVNGRIALVAEGGTEITDHTPLGLFNADTDVAVSTKRLNGMMHFYLKSANAVSPHICRGKVDTVILRKPKVGQQKMVKVHGMTVALQRNYSFRIDPDHSQLEVDDVTVSHMMREGETYADFLWDIQDQLNANSMDLFHAHVAKSYKDLYNVVPINKEEITDDSFLCITFGKIPRGTYNTEYVDNRYIDGKVHPKIVCKMQWDPAIQPIGDGLDVQRREYLAHMLTGKAAGFTPTAIADKMYCEMYVEDRQGNGYSLYVEGTDKNIEVMERLYVGLLEL